MTFFFLNPRAPLEEPFPSFHASKTVRFFPPVVQELEAAFLESSIPVLSRHGKVIDRTCEFSPPFSTASLPL